MVLPTPSVEERNIALARAGEVRRYRSRFKAQVKAGTVDPVVAFEKALGDKDLVRMRVRDFVQALPGVGAAKRVRVMEDLKIPASRRMGGLGARQRERLVDWLAHR